MKYKLLAGLAITLPVTSTALTLQGTQTFSENVNIPITHNYDVTSYGTHIGINIIKNSNTIFEKDVTIKKTEQDDLSGQSIFVGIGSDSPDGISSTLIKGNLLIDMQGEESIPLYLQGDDLTVNGNLTMNSSNEGIGTIYLNRQASLTVNGKTNISFSNNHEDHTAMFVSNAFLTLNDDSVIDGSIYVIGSGLAKINNKSIINGTILAEYGGTIILDLAKGSKITGTVLSFGDPDDDEPEEGEDRTGIIKMNLAKGAFWEINDKISEITELSGRGDVKFINNDSADDRYGELKIESLKGETTFHLRTDIVAQKGDKIIITKIPEAISRNTSAEGVHTLILTNNGASETTGKEKLTLVEIDNHAVTNTATFKTNHAIELGGYVYQLNKQENEWILASTGKKDDKNINQKPQISSSADASANFLNANYLMSYVENQTLLKRLGDMRNSGEFGDVWLRAFSGKLDSFAGGNLSKFDMNYHGFQFGIDKQLSEQSPFVIGAFVGQTYGDPDYRKGDGSLRSFNTGLYATYLDNNGWYIDGIAKYARQKNHFKVKDTANDVIQGSGRTNGLSASIEFGKKFRFNNFYIEPQSQLSYSHQNGKLIHASNGLNVKLGNYNSLMGRASALFGYEINTDNSKINLYAKTGIIREFDGDTYYKLNTSRQSHSFKGNWWNNSVGMSAQLNQQHTIYFDLESSKGNRFDLLQINGGYRYSF